MGRHFGVDPTSQSVISASVERQRCQPVEWVSDSSISCTLPMGIQTSAPFAVVRRRILESAPFTFEVETLVTTANSETLTLRSVGASLELVSLNVETGKTTRLGVFPTGSIDYGMTAMDSVNQVFYAISYDDDFLPVLSVVDIRTGSFSQVSIATSGANRRLLTVNTHFLMNVEFDPAASSVVCVFASRGCGQNYVLQVPSGTGQASVLTVVNGSIAHHIRAMDPFTRTYYMLLEDEDQQLVAVNTNPSNGPSPCETSGGKCQLMSSGDRDCVHVAASDNVADLAVAETICAALNGSCDYAQWEPAASMYVMRQHFARLETCEDARLVYGPKLDGIRSMAFHYEQQKLILVREDVGGVYRHAADLNYQVLSLGVAGLFNAPFESIYTRVQRRRLMQALAPVGTGLMIAPADLEVSYSFSAGRIMPGIITILYQHNWLLLQDGEGADSVVRVVPISDGTAEPATETLPFNDVRIIVPRDDLVAILSPKVRYLSPGLVSAQGGTDITILGEHFGLTDSSPVVRIDGKPCGETRWVSDGEVLCIEAPAKSSGSLLSLVGGQVAVGGFNTPAFFPSLLSYVSAPDVAAPTACCKLCGCERQVLTWENSGTTVVPMLLSQLTYNESVLLCGGGQSCAWRFEEGNAALVQAMSFDMEGSLTVMLTPFQNGNASFVVNHTLDGLSQELRFMVVTLPVNNPPSISFLQTGVLEVCKVDASVHARTVHFAHVSKGSDVSDELQQEVTIGRTFVSGNLSMFQPQMRPTLSETGQLVFSVLPGATGSLTMEFSIRDDGVLGSGLPFTIPTCTSIDPSASCHGNVGANQTLTITVSEPPSFAFGNASVPLWTAPNASASSWNTSSVNASGSTWNVSVANASDAADPIIPHVWTDGMGRVYLPDTAMYMTCANATMCSGASVYSVVVDGFLQLAPQSSFFFEVQRVGNSTSVLLDDPVVFQNGSLVLQFLAGNPSAAQTYSVDLVDLTETKCAGSSLQFTVVQQQL